MDFDRFFFGRRLKPHLQALKKSARHANFRHRADDFKARHSQFSTCKRIGPKCNVAPVLKILGVPRLPPEGSLGTGKRGTVPKILRAALIFLACVNGVSKFLFPCHCPWFKAVGFRFSSIFFVVRLKASFFMLLRLVSGRRNNQESWKFRTCTVKNNYF